MTSRISVGTGVVVINHRRELLLVKDRRAKRGGKDGRWGIVGGMLEDDLTFEDNALKEVREETGYTVRINALVGVYQHVDSDFNRISIVYRAEPLEAVGVPDQDEIVEVKWFAFDEIPFVDLRFPHNEQMIRDAYGLNSPAETGLSVLKTSYLVADGDE
jgi:ADP-ribose pyrophosphatase YjhB (NUDIX family)